MKQSRLAAFSNYTNPELTYEDIARPWRNLTTSVWGQTADETQGWWQEMVKSNDFAKAQTTLRERGLEQDITQVTSDGKEKIEEALIPEYEGKFVVQLVPNITNISYGRGVGYAIEEIVLPEKIQKISATKIRAKMKEIGKDILASHENIIEP